MLRNVLTKTLWDQRRTIGGWAIAVATVGVLYASFYPAMTTPDMAAAMEALPPVLLEGLGMTDITSPHGYLGSTTYGLLGPVLMIIFAATMGTRAIAGEEESGRLDVLLAHPVERWSVVVQRAAAMAIALIVAGTLLLVAMAIASGPAEFASLGIGNLAAASAQLVLLALVLGSVGLAAGALTGSVSIANGVVAVIAIAAYLANTLAPTIDAIAWAQNLSPFFYFNGGQPLVNGLQVVDSLILLGTAVVLVTIAAVGFTRRDVAV
jgi:ABC-2 type transport system permease protein